MEATRIKWNLGYTMNLGNFQSMRLDCEISDSAREFESVFELSDRVYKATESELVRKIKEAKAEVEEL